MAAQTKSRKGRVGSPRRPRQLTAAEMQTKCNSFNQAYPAGTEMRAWKGLMGEGPGEAGKVREPGAYILSGHTPVVHLDGVSGCIVLSHVRPEASCAPKSEGKTS